MTIDPRVEADYVFSHRYPERQQVYDRIDNMSARTRRALRCALDIAYGDDPLERLDLFPGEAGRALVVFIHGGYWRSMDKRSFSYVARPLVELGYSVAVINYPLSPRASLGAMVSSVERAVDWIGEDGRAWLPECGGTVLAGHSAGGHLAAFVAAARGTAGGIAGCVCISGIFDLEPIVKTTIGAHVGLVPADVPALSPLARAPFDGWVVLAVGSEETPGFVEVQTGRFAVQRAAQGVATELVHLAQANHYTVLLALAHSDTSLIRAMHARMRQAVVR